MPVWFAFCLFAFCILHYEAYLATLSSPRDRDAR